MSSSDDGFVGRRPTHRPRLAPFSFLDECDSPAWMNRGLCAQTDPEIFYPDKGGSAREAKRICGTCPVQAECLAYSLAHEVRYGVWGGKSERERRKLAGPRRPGRRPNVVRRPATTDERTA